MGPPTVDINVVLAIVDEVSADAERLATPSLDGVWVDACAEVRRRLEAALAEGRP